MTSGLTSGIFALASAVTLALFALAQPALAQGSTGGSIGVQEKSVSGDRQAPPRAAPPPQRHAPAPAPKRAVAPRNYDGVWFVTNIGCGGGSGAVTASGGRVSGGNGLSGSISANGAVRTASAVAVGWGKISGNHASGGFRTNDGCTGRWTAVRR